MWTRAASVLVLALAACSVEEFGAATAADGAAGLSGSGALSGAGGAPAGGAGGGGTGGGDASATGGSSGAGTGGGGGEGAASDAATDAGPEPGDAVGDGGIATQLHGARLELPCQGVLSSQACAASQASKSFSFEGEPGVVYDVTLRVRGVVEENAYTGLKSGKWCIGGQPAVAGWNVFSVKVGSPAEIYYLNSGTAGNLWCHLLDYTVTLPITGGALVELAADAMDGQQVRNIDQKQVPIVVPDVSPAPLPFDGQFVQLDVVSVQKK